jgi:hypothetical protein
MKLSKRNFRKLTLGDVLEIPITNQKLAYAQYIYNYKEPPAWGHLIRVLPGLYNSRPGSLTEIVNSKERFVVFFPVGAALRAGMISIISNEMIPESNIKFPLFKTFVPNLKTGKKTWRIWDGNETRKVDELLPEHRDLPMKEIVSFDLLVDRIKSGWSPKDDV